MNEGLICGHNFFFINKVKLGNTRHWHEFLRSCLFLWKSSWNHRTSRSGKQHQPPETSNNQPMTIKPVRGSSWITFGVNVVIDHVETWTETHKMISYQIKAWCAASSGLISSARMLFIFYSLSSLQFCASLFTEY